MNEMDSSTKTIANSLVENVKDYTAFIVDLSAKKVEQIFVINKPNMRLKTFRTI